MVLHLEKKHKNVFLFDIKAKSRKEDFWFLLQADHHWDSLKCDRELMEHHLKQAQERNAPVLMFGDFFDCMGGKYDPRSNKEDIRPEFQNKNYFDSIVDGANEWLKPYAENIKFISKGNHEMSIVKHQETDLIERLTTLLNYNGATCHPAGYTGWIVFRTEVHNKRSTIKMNFTHGSGGGGPVSKCVIQSNRRAASIDADIYVAGHIHENWMLEVPREILSHISLKPQLKVCTHLQIPSYKEEYLCGDGWARERGMPPKPKGAWWLRIFWSYRHNKYIYEVMKAEE